MPQEPHQQISPDAGKTRVVAGSSSAELRLSWAWALTAIVIVAGGVTLYAARAPIGSAFDRWLPRLERPVESALLQEPPPPEPAPVAEPAVTEPEWTYVDIEAALRPLPEQTETLIAEGRGEMSQFSDLDSTDETRALVTQNRWRLWGRVWQNRVNHLRGPMPPAEVCDIHAALEPTCRAIRDSLSLLDRVPSVDSVGEAKELFDGAASVLEAFRESQAEPDEKDFSSRLPEP